MSICITLKHVLTFDVLILYDLFVPSSKLSWSWNLTILDKLLFKLQAVSKKKRKK